jgi:hypothetical protein
MAYLNKQTPSLSIASHSLALVRDVLLLLTAGVCGCGRLQWTRGSWRQVRQGGEQQGR